MSSDPSTEAVRTPVLLTGASGYVGSRLLPRLRRERYRVRRMVRRLDSTADAETVVGDVLNPESLRAALSGVRTAFYLVHLMGAGEAFEEKDREAAANFVRAAEDAGVERIIYLGGIAPPADDLSPHLRSRLEVGRILASGAPEVIELRASVVLGAGSLSFEMVRTLTERLPVMVTPRWVNTKAQPIAVADLLDALVAAGRLPRGDDRVIEVGGSDRVGYGEIMREYARQRGLPRVMIPVPFLTPGLSSLWLALVTPLFARIGRQLVESIRHPTVVQHPTPVGVLGVEPHGVADAIREALETEDGDREGLRATIRAAADGSRPHGTRSFGNRVVDVRSVRCGTPPADAFAAVERIGGAHGWYAADGLWRLRAAIDRLLGGVGMRRGRGNPDGFEVGDRVDFWRVEAAVPRRWVLLRAEMKLPGRAWLAFDVDEEGDGSLIRQAAVFDPKGVTGRAYWWALYPVHALLFHAMLRRIARAAERARSA